MEDLHFRFSVILSRAKDPRERPRHAIITPRLDLHSRQPKNGTLYVGVTTGLRNRVWQHKAGVVDGFTKQYRVTTLVHFEEFHDIRDAISREKEIKGWN